MTGPSHDRAGFALLTVLLGLIVLVFISATAASLAALARRSARGALDTVTAEAAVEGGLSTLESAVPDLPGSSLAIGLSPPPPPGWVGRRTLVRLAGNLVLVRVNVERPAGAGRLAARSEGEAIWQLGDSGRLVRVPGGWVSGP